MKNLFMSGVSAIVFAVAGVACAAGNNSETRMWYDSPAVRWTDALPIGNGKMGAMVFSGVANERLQINEYTFWSGRPHCYARKDSYKNLAEVRKLVAEKKKGGEVNEINL